MTPLEMADTVANLIQQMHIAYSVDDHSHYAHVHSEASRIIGELVESLDGISSPHPVTLQTEIGEWGNATFPKGTPSSILAHLAKELIELSEGHDPEEAADCYLLLLHFAHRKGFILEDEARRKFGINKTRTWGEPDADGVVEHIRKSGDKVYHLDASPLRAADGTILWTFQPSPPLTIDAGTIKS